MKENWDDNISYSNSNEIDKIKKYCLEEELSKCIKGFDEIEILDCLNSKSRSNVYHISITSNNNNKKDAIIKLLSNKRKSKDKEVYVSKILKNKNIIDCYTQSFLDQIKSPFLIMEYAEYGNLRDFNEKFLKCTYFSESLICYLAYQILNGIKYMHIYKVVHMDIKPQNIVVDLNLNAKIVDFSNSFIYQKKRPEDYIKLPFVGIKFYMSREKLKSDKIKVMDLHKIDLYAFGVTLYNLAFDKYPYGLEKEDAHDYKIILEKKKTNELTFPNKENYSSYFLDFISKLLEKDIEKRNNMLEAMNHPWIKGAKIILDEKEKLNNDKIFLSNLLADHFSDFNIYINQSQ
jgi:serine/threonine protein kinase